ncbi:uncharacterized protein CXQ87_003967 [Candidozyma duobushaemuli]|uniref:Ubiquitin-like modifier HUB1 n=1 Tax=Candidozyma duobushaemuli TaxID=1231522 RepID=A0A2V1AFU2_9ASCO|nr:uncharacterized protein CXQ87_003967 [[Candida] duobushaemulonis]PVH16103.1 hypothetical protein CXQ87_003967 [[Candida] duobushaemulonis]
MDVHKRSHHPTRSEDVSNEKEILDESTTFQRTRPAFQEENDGILPTSMPGAPERKSNHSLPKKDLKAFIILVILYTLQGVPVGLAFGSVPFILKSKLSYAQVGVFSLASYPYSLKLLWSPIVDAIYSRKVGRRKSWIIPVQLVSGVTLLYLGFIIDKSMANPAPNLIKITTCFFLLVLFCATQDIAVDGWALTVLSPESLSFASTAQTVGMNCGYFSSFTVFLALSSPEFANKYLRSEPQEDGLFGLGGYLTFWGWMYILITALLVFVPEDPPHLAKHNHEKLNAEHYKHESAHNRPLDKTKQYMQDLLHVYNSMYQVLRLPNVQTFVVILLFAKLGFQVNEAATNLKLLEKGLSKEDLSITVLIDFPFEMIFGYYSGRWSSGKSPLRPWLFGFAGRLFAALCAHIILLFFPNLHGEAVPFRLIILYLIDRLTVARCENVARPYDLLSEEQKRECTQAGGSVVLIRDGYFYTSAICITLGVIIWFWVKRKARYLQSLPQSAWRVNKNMIEVNANDRLGKKIKVKCLPEDTIGDLKKILSMQLGTTHEKIVLKKGHQIYKDHISLDDYEINNGFNFELYYG